MGIIDRHFTYKNYIRISPSDYDLAIQHKKNLTIRLGDISVDKSVMYLTDGRRRLYVDFLNIVAGVKFHTLTDEHAKQEGFQNVYELKADLSRYYGNIDPDQPFTLIYFQLKDNN